MEAALKRLTELGTISLQQPVTWAWKKHKIKCEEEAKDFEAEKTVSEESLMTLKTRHSSIDETNKIMEKPWKLLIKDNIFPQDIFAGEPAGDSFLQPAREPVGQCVR